MNLLQINVLDEQKRIADVLESMAVKTFGSVPEHKRSLLKPSARVVSRLGELHVTVVSATGLPRMDLIRSCDPYCVLYIDGHGDQQTHITETVPKSQTPHWNEKFVWDLYTDTRIVTISLWDRDNVRCLPLLLHRCFTFLCSPFSSPLFSLLLTFVLSLHPFLTCDLLVSPLSFSLLPPPSRSPFSQRLTHPAGDQGRSHRNCAGRPARSRAKLVRQAA